ncbi:MAG: hypothetical protein ACM3OA_12740, partial [Acidobacteriota bacterium]
MMPQRSSKASAIGASRSAFIYKHLQTWRILIAQNWGIPMCGLQRNWARHNSVRLICPLDARWCAWQCGRSIPRSETSLRVGGPVDASRRIRERPFRGRCTMSDPIEALDVVSDA